MEYAKTLEPSDPFAVRDLDEFELGEARRFIALAGLKADRPEIVRQLGQHGWARGERGGISWTQSDQYVREAEPRFLARSTRLFNVGALARFHYAEGDIGLRRLTLVFDAMSPERCDALEAQLDRQLEPMAGPQLLAPAKWDVGYERTLHRHSSERCQVVVDLWAKVPVTTGDEEASMEEYFIYD